MESYPVITLWQPWASWVVLGWKTLETRTHPRFANLVGKRIAIHAGQKWDETALTSARPYLTPEQIRQTESLRSISGAILGTAKVAGHRALAEADSPRALIDCGSTPRFGLVLTDIKAITPIPIKGKQGIWRATIG